MSEVSSSFPRSSDLATGITRSNAVFDFAFSYAGSVLPGGAILKTLVLGIGNVATDFDLAILSGAAGGNVSNALAAGYAGTVASTLVSVALGGTAPSVAKRSELKQKLVAELGSGVFAGRPFKSARFTNVASDKRMENKETASDLRSRLG